MHLIVGGDSVIGKALGNYWEKNNIDFHSSTRNSEFSSKIKPFIDLENLDLTNLDCSYDSVVLCAAVSKLDECEKHPNRTRKINVINTFKLAQRLSNSGAMVLLLSTNQVFDGKIPHRKINDEKNPINEYGKQKSEMEDLMVGLEQYGILRLTKVIHPKLSLLLKWRDMLENGEKISAFKDMYFSPIDIKKVIVKIDFLAKERAIGVFHCSGDTDISYYDFAIEYVKELGFSKELVKEDFCKTKGVTPVRFTSLSSDC